MVFIGSGVSIEQVPPPPKMEEVRRELDAAMLQVKKYCINNAKEQNSSEDTPVKRYIFASTVMRNDRFFSLKSAVPSLPKKNGFVEEEHEDGSLRLEVHETVEGRRGDIIEDDVTTLNELEKQLPFEFHQWEHEISIQKVEPEPNTTATIWRVGDHLFSFEEPLDLNVKLPDQVHYFFTGEHLPEKRRLYTSLPNLSVAGLVETSAFDHSAHSFYGHGFRQVGTTHLSRTMESLNEDRLQMGTRPSLNEMRGEPPPEPYFPLRSRMSPFHVRSPPLSPTNEEWRRSPFPAFSRYSACGRTGLEIIGRNGERGRVTSPTLQEENLPKYIAEGKQQRIYEKTTLKDSSWEFRHEKTENKSRVEQGEPIKKHDFDVYRDQRQNFKPTESISGYQNESTIDTKEVSRPWRQDEKFNKNDFDIHPDPRHGASVPEKSLGDDFEKNLNHFWQLREGMTTLTPLATENQLVSQETTTSRDDTPKTSGIIWDVKNIFGETRTRAPPIRQTSEDQSSEIEEQDYSYREPEEQTVTNAMELLMSSERVQSTNQPGDGEEHIHGNTTKMEYENEAPSKRTSIQAKKNRFSRKHTPYYDQAFFSSLEDELSEAAGTLELSHGYPERTLEPVDVTFTLKPNKFEDTMLPKRFASIPPYRPKAVVADELFNVSTNRNTTQRDEVVSLTGVSFPPYESRRKEKTDILLAESQEIRNQSSKEKDTLPAATISPTSFLPPSDARRPTQLQPLSVQSWQPTFKQHQKTQVPPGYPVTTEVLRVDHSLSHRKFEHEDLPARKVSLPEYSDKQNLRTVQQMADQHSNVEDMTGQRVDGESLTGQEQLTQLPTTEMPSNKKSVLCEADTNCQPLSLRSWQATFKQKPLPDQSCVGSPQPALYIPVDNTLTHSKFEHQFLPEQKIPIPEYPNTGGFERKDVVTTTVNVFSTKQPAVGSATLVDSRERFGRYRGTFEDSGYGSSTVSQKMPPDSLRHGYTLVTASGQFPQSTKSKIKTVSPTTEKLHSPRIRHWEVEDTPPMFRNIASPESEEVAQINFPLHESPKTKKKKLFVEKRVEEVVEKIETLTDWWGGKKSFDSSFGTTTFTKEPTSKSKDNKIDHSELSHTDSFKKETLSDSVNTSGVTPKTTSSMTEDMEKTFADFKQWSSKMFADGEKVLQDAREKSNKSSTQTTPLIFAPNEKVHLQGYPQTTETVAYVSEVLTNNELVHNVLINKRLSIPPYPAHPKSTSDSMQGFVSTETAKIQITDKDTKADRRTTKGQLRHITIPVTQQYQESVSTAVQTNDFTTGSKNESGPLIGTGTKNETLWQITGYPVRTEVKSEVSETLKRTELSHEELPKRARPVPPYPYFRPSLSEEQTKQERASTFKSNLLDTWKLKKTESGENDDKKTFAHRESIKLTELPEIEKFKSHPYKSEHLKTSNIDIDATFTSFKSKDLWDHRGYPKSKECVNKAPEALPFLEMEQRQLNVMKRDYPPYPVTAALKTSLGFGKSARQKEHVDAEPVTSKFSDTKTEVVKQSQQRPEDRRESQTLNMMVGFGELKEPRKMKWDARGYPSFQRAQEIHETLAPREHVHIDLSPKREDIPPYPDTWRKQNVKKESEYAEIIPKSQRQKQTEVSIQRLHSNKTKAAPAPPVSHDAKTPFWFTKGENVDRNGYPQKTEHQEVTETTSYISFSEAPVPKRYSPVPTYPVKYSEYSRLIENPSMVESRRVRTASAPPIPEHFKKPPPPYEPVRPPRHSDDVKGILKPQKHIIPEEPAAAAPLRIPRTDSDLARRDFDAVFQDDSRRSWDENNSETQISSTEVREMEILLRGATRVAETTTWQDDWDIAEEIVDESLKTAICQSRSASKTAEELNPSNTSMKSFEMEPQLGGLASESEAEIIPVPKPPQEKDYSKGVSDFSKQHHKNKGFFNFFRKKQDHHGNEQFIEESPYNIQLIAGDRPDLYREEPQMHHQPGVKGRIKKRNSREEHAIGKRPFGGIFHFRRSQSHDEVLVEERPLENVEPGPSRKRSSSMHEMFESARHNITKSKNYIYGVANKQKRREGEHVEHEQPRLIGYEHGNNELPVDVPAALAPRFPVYKRKSEISPDTSDSDPDNIKNILAGVIREKNEVIDKIETERQANVESSYTSASTIEIGQGVRQDTLYHAVPVNIHDEPVYPTSSENKSSIEEAALHYEEFQSAPITTTTASNYNAYYTTESTVSHDLYADAPSPPHEAEELPTESMIVEPPSPELQRSAEKFATEFTEKLAKVEDVLREAELYVQKNNNERIYDSVYEERIYDEVPVILKAEVAPPVPSSPVPKRNEELHYAAVAIATDDHLYRDDEHIYEEIGEGHIVESSPYAEPVHLSEEQHIVESTHYAEAPAYNPYDSAADEKVVVYEEPEYAEVPKEDVITKVVHKVEHSIANLKQKFESRTKESHYGRIEAPKRKDYLYDENYNAQIEDHQLSRTPEIAQTPIDHVNYREVKPYVGSPSFNKLQKQFFPEDLEERKARWEDKEEVDLSVLKSPTTIVTNNGVTEIETRAYDKNNYEETATVVVKSPVDKESALATLAIRRMSKNNQWGEDEIDSPRLYNAYESAPMSPVVKVSPLPSPRPVSVSPRFDSSPSSPRPESPKIVVKSQIGRPAELDIHVDKVTRTSPVERVVSSVEKTSASADTQFQSVSVKDRRKLFENGGAPSQPSYAPVVKLRSTAGRIGTGASVVKSVEVLPPAKVHEPVSSPAEVELKRVVVGVGATPTKQEDSNKRMSVLEMRRAYEASVTASQSSSSSASPQRSRDNSKRRGTGEVQIGTGASLSKYSEEQSSAARRTVHRTLEKHMHEGVTIPLGQGVQVSIERRDESPLTVASNSTIGQGVSVVRELSPQPVQRTPSPSVGYGATAVREFSPQPVQRTPSPSVGYGATAASASQQKFFSTSSSTIGQGVSVQREVHQTTSYQQSSISAIGQGALPTSAPPPVVEPLIPVQPSLTIEVPLEVAQPVQEVRESTAEVEEEPIPLQRNGSGRRSWPVKTYENNIRFDNQKKKLKMPDVDFSANGHLNGIEKMNGEENASLKDWDPRPLVQALYEVSYEPRLETKRNRFFNMEGHVEFPSDETNTLAELEREWKQRYIRTKEGRLQIFVSHCAEEAPAEDIVLSGCDIDANKEDRTFTIHGGRDHIRMLLRVPSSTFDKWRQALLSHAASSQIDAYVKPVSRTMEHLTERVIIIEIGSCSIRGGRLTQETSLPQSFFPAIGIRTDDGKIIVGEDAFAPQVRHRGEFVRPIQASDPAVERYTMDKDVVKACMNKVVSDLQVDPTKYKVLLSIPQNIPIVLISELVTIALQDIKFQGAAITRQPSLILYAYDVTTGVVVDIGDRLNIVPVIDGYVVDSAICSIPYGATQVREALRSDLCANNKGLYSFQSPIEKLILRYAMEQASYVPEDYQKEEQSRVKDVMISLDPFQPTPGMQTKFNIDSSRFTCTEGLFRPKKWGLDTKGLHHLVHEAVQMSPIDSRRTLYRNIFLAGGASLLPGLAEKLEQELANIVPNTIHTQVHISPWRYNAAYLGAQVVASSATFEDKCVTAENLQKFLYNLSTSTF